MKNLFIFIVLAGLAAGGYFLYPELVDGLRARNLLPGASPRILPASKPGDTAPAPTPPAATAPPAPAPAPRPAPPISIPADVEAEIAALIPMPRFKPLAEITANWTMVPERAFPETVALRKPATLRTPQGTELALGVGEEAVPESLAPDGTLTLASKRGSLLKASLPVDDTDFKDRVTKRYNDSVAQMNADAEKRRQAERARRATAVASVPAPASPDTPAAAPAGSDAQNLALMKQSIASGELEGVTAAQVRSVRPLGSEEIAGETFWTGAAAVVKSTYFGEFETEARAYIRNGRVEKWSLATDAP